MGFAAEIEAGIQSPGVPRVRCGWGRHGEGRRL